MEFLKKNRQQLICFYVFLVITFVYAVPYLAGYLNNGDSYADQLTLLHDCLISSAFAGQADIKQNKGSGTLNQAGQNKFSSNPAFEISVKSALRKYKKAIFIDVRGSEEFKLFRIPGSLNIPLYAIKSKTFLKQKSLILVNEGFEVLKLKKQCLRLKDTGFLDVKILKGGLNAWRANKGEVHGDLFAMKTLNRVSSDLLFKEKNNKNLLVIDISNCENTGPDDSKNTSLFPGAVPIPLKMEEASWFCKKVKLEIHNHGPSINPVLMFNKTGENYSQIDRLLKKAGIPALFYLEKGGRGYKKYLSLQARMGQFQKRSTKRGHKCATCP